MSGETITRPLTERQAKILALLRGRDGAMSANQIALALGFDWAPSQGGLGAGRGSGAGTAPAQHVISSLNGLKRRGLIYGGGDGTFGAS